MNKIKIDDNSNETNSPDFKPKIGLKDPEYDIEQSTRELLQRVPFDIFHLADVVDGQAIEAADLDRQVQVNAKFWISALQEKHTELNAALSIGRIDQVTYDELVQELQAVTETFETIVQGSLQTEYRNRVFNVLQFGKPKEETPTLLPFEPKSNPEQPRRLRKAS